MHLSVGAATHMGLVRRENEDNHAVLLPIEASAFPARGSLLVVADGMGGHAAGARASQLAVDALVRAYYDPETPGDPERALTIGFAEAHEAVLQYTHAYPESAGMGTTLVAASLLPPRAIIANVGDSRALLARLGGIQQITEDHTVAQQMIAEATRSGGLRGEEQAVLLGNPKASPFGHQLTRCIGCYDSFDGPDIFPLDLEPGDALVLASDGLTGPVDADEIAAVLDREPSPSVAAHLLTRLALDRGGPDNITVVVARFESLTP